MVLVWLFSPGHLDLAPSSQHISYQAVLATAFSDTVSCAYAYSDANAINLKSLPLPHSSPPSGVL